MARNDKKTALFAAVLLLAGCGRNLPAGTRPKSEIPVKQEE